jgi:hypothetical protein
MSDYPNGGTPPTITEDNPAWDCTTMGNLTCGTTQVTEHPNTGGSIDTLLGVGIIGTALGILLIVAAATKRLKGA